MSTFNPSLDLTPSLYDDALMSILPKHAARLYRGTKLFELRKTVPRSAPKRIFLYEADGVAAITGHIIIDEILAGSPEGVWNLTGEAGTTRSAFEAYFAGRQIAYAFRVGAAVKYSQPITLEATIGIEPGFRVPQNFLYLRNLPHLRSRLSDLALQEAFASTGEILALSPVQDADRPQFVELVKKHVSKGYAETGRAYAQKLLEIADAGEDTEGFLTTSKEVCSIRYQGRSVGFAVLTFKLGGSIKTGPVILAERYQKKGIGKLLRSKVHEIARSLGYRKVFATVPANNLSAIQYLLSSGYRIEAHLITPYHPKHNEFVLGALLSPKRGPSPEFIRQITPFTEFAKVTECAAEIAGFLRNEFSAAYCRVSDEWCLKQLRMAVDRTSSFKPRFIVAGHAGALMALAICLPKRGGSMKVLVLTRSGHQGSLVGLIDAAANYAKQEAGIAVRRIYTQVPSGDTDVISAFQAFGCRAEGIIELPFTTNTDTIVLAKRLS